ncbi:MAG: hydantoinase/oxoprolinase family protein [Phycisphaeraceae bacterium]|nr:hydantoinase/oxoprolinase family protein [Phycisphaeraceae bacterium]
MTVAALDIGGANLKAACLNGPVLSEPFALWKAPDKLPGRLKALLDRLGPVDRLAITLTAELCDCYASRREGVEDVVSAARAAACGRPVTVWSTDGQLIPAETAADQTDRVAAANWHALATWAGRQWPDQRLLVVDTGSTTTDLIPVLNGQVTTCSRTDPGRLRHGELVYIGGDRTPLMALGPVLNFNGTSTRIMAEWFATLGDCRLVTGDLPADPDRTDTADGRPRTPQAARRRVLRMIGEDSTTAGKDAAEQLAEAFLTRAREQLTDALSGFTDEPDRVILSGSGASLIRPLLEARWPGAARTELSEFAGDAASDAACAWALAQLADILATETTHEQ